MSNDRPTSIVVGAGFAGLSAAARRWPTPARGCSCSTRGRSSAAGRRRSPIARPASSSTTASTCCSAVIARRWRSCTASAPTDNVTPQARAERAVLDRPGRRSELRCPALPSPLHLLAGVLRWDALPWRDRLSALRMAPPLRPRGAALRRTRSRRRRRRRTTVSDWLREHGQSRALTEWLWEPLAVAALISRPTRPSAAPFVRVLAEMFGPDAGASALVLPNRPLHLMYAEPARAFIERPRRRRCHGRAGADRGRRHACRWRRRARRAHSALACRLCRAVVRACGTCSAARRRRRWPASCRGAGAMTSKPIVTVNLWYDRPVMDEPFVGLPGRIDAVGLRQALRVRRARPRTCRWSRAAPTR